MIRSGILLGAFAILASSTLSLHAEDLSSWQKTHDRVWLGGTVWANPMEDWRVADGWAECQNGGANRSVHSLTHQITNPKAGFSMSVEMIRPTDSRSNHGGGFRLGVRSELNEHRSNCFARGGINAGITGNQLVLGKKRSKLKSAVGKKPVALKLTGSSNGDKVTLKLELSSTDGKSLGSISQEIEADTLLGNIALVSRYSGEPKRIKAPGYQFRKWTADGDAFSVKPEQRFGPLLWSMYSLSDSRSDEGFVMKMSALTGPMGAKDHQEVELEVQRKGKWKSLGTATLDPDAWTATFRIPKWNEKTETLYRLVYHELHKDGTRTRDEWSGTVKANPSGRPLRIAALTCQNDYGFPYEPVAENLVKLDADLLYFSGDQLYENHGGFGIIRRPAEPAILNYLRKYYQHGWSFREAMRNSPTLCLPDDHDVFHGNIWGEGGAPADKKTGGGYMQPARMVNAVHKTNCAHHPDPHDPKPSKQDISVYYGDMVYGNVGFAILADRQWKSGPARVSTWPGRPDHVKDMDFDTSAIDKPGLVMLGERQEKFLKQWAADWRGHSMKIVLSQTVFSAVATHHGNYNGYLKGDLDSGGWPQTPRNRAIDLMRPAMALHINGDQHLGTLSQYGVKKQRDSNWAFCTPAISAGYPRWWRPDEIGMKHENRPAHGHPNTGEFLDGFGNKTYVYAVGNPVVGKAKNRYERAHEKGSGFGFVTVDTDKKTYALDAFRFKVDATEGQAEDQFPGWPVTIQQKENRGENVIK